MAVGNCFTGKSEPPRKLTKRPRLYIQSIFEFDRSKCEWLHCRKNWQPSIAGRLRMWREDSGNDIPERDLSDGDELTKQMSNRNTEQKCWTHFVRR